MNVSRPELVKIIVLLVPETKCRNIVRKCVYPNVNDVLSSNVTGIPHLKLFRRSSRLFMTRAIFTRANTRANTARLAKASGLSHSLTRTAVVLSVTER